MRSNFPGWEQVSPGFWRNSETGEEWRGWRQYGARAGHFPGAVAAKRKWRATRKSESEYSRRLRQIARHVDDIVRGVSPTDPAAVRQIEELLDRYADRLDPWARAVAERMLAEVARRDTAAWHETGKLIGRNLRREIETLPPVRTAMQGMLAEQVKLIRSLPDDARVRVHDLTVTGLSAGTRWEAIAQEILETGHVTRGRANTIGRTEVGRASTTLTKSRAEYLGSPGYVWRATHDKDVRPRHAQLDGQFILWNKPPRASEDDAKTPMYYHAGAGPNCFPGNTIVSLASGCRRLFRAFYDGPLVCLKTAIEVIEATPNHPMLTARGWVPAQLLDEGDYLACMPVKINLIGDDNKNQCKTTFAEIFSALRSQARHRIVAKSFDFHGDIFDGDVDLVFADDLLLDELQAMIRHDRRELMLAKTNRRIAAGRVRTCGDQVVPSSGTRLLNARDMLIADLVGGHDDVGFKGSAHLDSGVDQPLANRLRGRANLAGNGRNAGTVGVHRDHSIGRQSPGLGDRSLPFADAGVDTESPQFQTEDIGIAANAMCGGDDGAAVAYQFRRIENKGLRDFSGHVFTMETYTGQYGVGVDKIQSKNCRCHPEPVLAGETPQTGHLPRSEAYLESLREAGYETGAAF